MSEISLFISSLKNSIKDFVSGQESGELEDEDVDAQLLQDTPVFDVGSDDEGASGVVSASDEEVLAFASYLGINVEHHKDLLWVAQEALASPLPYGWKECVGEGGVVFFVQKDTNIVQWEHPLDVYYKSLARKLIQEKEASVKRLVSIAEETLDASVPFFAKGDHRQQEVVECFPEQKTIVSTATDYKCHSQAVISECALADAEAAAAAAALAAAQAAAADAVHNVSKLEKMAAEADVRAADSYRRSLASAAAYAADKVGDPKRDRRRKVLQFMQFLGMNPHEDQHLYWIAEEAANSPLPPHWEQLENEFGQEYFYNRRTEDCRTTHPLEQHYRALYIKHRFPDSDQVAANDCKPEIASLLSKADSILPQALRAALNYTTSGPLSESVSEQQSTSPAKSMMSLAASSRDGVAVYWSGYAICGCIKSIHISNVSGADVADAAAVEPQPSLFPAAIVADNLASMQMRISVDVCSESRVLLECVVFSHSPICPGSSSRGLCHWCSSVWWRLRSAVISNGHSMMIQHASVRWQVLQVTQRSNSSSSYIFVCITNIEQNAVAARGVLLALAKLCAPSNWHRRHLLALEMCVSAAAGDTAACNSIINDFLDANEPLDRSDRDVHLKAKLKLQLQRNSIDIHLAQFAGYAIGAAAPIFSAVVGVPAARHTSGSASFDSKVIHQILQYCSDFLATPFEIAAHVGKMVEEAIDQDVQSQCRSAILSLASCCHLLD